MLGAGRVEGLGHARYREHLDTLGVPVVWREAPGDVEVATYTVGRVEARLVGARDRMESLEDSAAAAAYLAEFETLCADAPPDIVLALGGHPAMREAMRRARARGAKTLFALRFFGYEDARFFRHVDVALTPSRFLSDHYRRAIGLRSVALPSPLVDAEVTTPLGSEAARAFLTFVNPSLRKGVALFARLAESLASERPELPILVVGSGASLDALRSVPGMDLGRHPNVMAMAPTLEPREYLALTRVLLVPSANAEPAGRVNAEAMLNGIPVVASDRGGIPETLAGAGTTLSLPKWMTERTRRIPTATEVRPWVEAVVRLWDDAAHYAATAERARETGARLYAESVLKAAHFEVLEKLLAGELPRPL